MALNDSNTSQSSAMTGRGGEGTLEKVVGILWGSRKAQGYTSSTKLEEETQKKLLLTLLTWNSMIGLSKVH